MMEYKPFFKISRLIKEKTSESIDETVYFICLCVIIVLFNLTCSAFVLEDIPSVYRYVRLARYVVLLIMLFNGIVIGGEYTLKELLIYGTVLVLLTVISIRSGEKNILFSLLIILSSKGRSLNKIAKVYMFTYIAITVSVIILFSLGVIPDFIMYRADGMIRHSLGFNHPNLLGMFLFTIILCYLVAYSKKQQGMLFYLIVAAVIVFIYIVPNSRTAALCILTLIIAYNLKDLSIWKKNYGKILLYSVPVLFCLVSLIGAYIYDENSAFWVLLNKFVSGRFSLAYYVIQKAGISGLFGNNISWLGMPVDNCYARMLVFYGITVIVLFMTAYIFAMYRSYSKGRMDMIMYFIVFAFYGMSEVFTLCVMYNVLLMAITAAIPEFETINT